MNAAKALQLATTVRTTPPHTKVLTTMRMAYVWLEIVVFLLQILLCVCVLHPDNEIFSTR